LASRRSHLILVGLLVAALIGVVLLAVPSSPAHRTIRKGLDLQGGLEVVLQAVPPKGHTLTAEDLDRSVDIMRRRVDALGVSEPEIRKQGADQIVIELAGVHDPAQALAIIGKTAQLQLFDMETSMVPGVSISATGIPIATTSLHDLLTRVQSQAAKQEGSTVYLFRKTTVPPKKGTKKGSATTKYTFVASAPTVRDLKQDPKVQRIMRRTGPERRRSAAEGRQLLLPLQARPESEPALAGDDRRAAEAEGDAPGLRPDHR
jgi:preprotein translocase subunit SecD